MPFVDKCLRHLGRLTQYNRQYVFGALARHSNGISRNGVPPSGDEILRQAPCYFVLSTGRCGTGLLTKLLSKSRELLVVHQPTPELVYASARAYQLMNGSPKVLEVAALASRFDLVQESYLQGRVLVETNNRITYFCRALSRVFVQSKFIHLVRHPGDFARSVLRRQYYTSDLVHDGLLRPRENDPLHAQWDSMSRIEKVTWLWNELQTFAERFKEEVGQARIITVRSEDFYTDVATLWRIYEFLGTDPPLPDHKIARLLRRRVNAQKTGSVPRFQDWTSAEKQAARKWANMAALYGYEML